MTQKDTEILDAGIKCGPFVYIPVMFTWVSCGSPPPHSPGSSVCLRAAAAAAAAVAHTATSGACPPWRCYSHAGTRLPPCLWPDTVAVSRRDPAACFHWLAWRTPLRCRCRRRGWLSSSGGLRALSSRLCRPYRRLRSRNFLFYFFFYFLYLSRFAGRTALMSVALHKERRAVLVPGRVSVCTDKAFHHYDPRCKWQQCCQVCVSNSYPPIGPRLNFRTRGFSF